MMSISSFDFVIRASSFTKSLLAQLEQSRRELLPPGKLRAQVNVPNQRERRIGLNRWTARVP